MSRVILQVPMSRMLKEQAEIEARNQGFSSLQETIRVILNMLAKQKLAIRVSYPEEEELSPRAKRRYTRIIKDIKAGRNIVRTDSVEDFLQKLRS